MSCTYFKHSAAYLLVGRFTADDSHACSSAILSVMSQLLVQLAEAARASYSGEEDVLTAQYLETCRGLLPIVGGSF